MFLQSGGCFQLKHPAGASVNTIECVLLLYIFDVHHQGLSTEEVSMKQKALRNAIAWIVVPERCALH